MKDVHVLICMSKTTQCIAYNSRKRRVALEEDKASFMTNYCILCAGKHTCRPSDETPAAYILNFDCSHIYYKNYQLEDTQVNIFLTLTLPRKGGSYKQNHIEFHSYLSLNELNA